MSDGHNEWHKDWACEEWNSHRVPDEDGDEYEEEQCCSPSTPAHISERHILEVVVEPQYIPCSEYNLDEQCCYDCELGWNFATYCKAEAHKCYKKATGYCQ